MSRRRGAKYDSPELELGDDAVEFDAGESPAEVVTPSPISSISPDAYDVEIDLGPAELGFKGFFVMKKAIRRIRREYIGNLKALKGRNVTVIMRVSGAPNT